MFHLEKHVLHEDYVRRAGQKHGKNKQLWSKYLQIQVFLYRQIMETVYVHILLVFLSLEFVFWVTIIWPPCVHQTDIYYRTWNPSCKLKNLYEGKLLINITANCTNYSRLTFYVAHNQKTFLKMTGYCNETPSRIPPVVSDTRNDRLIKITPPKKKKF